MVSTAVVSEVFNGLNFPVQGQKCIGYAKKRNASEELIGALEQMPDCKFVGLAGVWHAIREEHKPGQMPEPIRK